jgi:hypothetical protein
VLGEFLMNWKVLSLIVLVFIFGWLTNGVYSQVSKDLSYFEWDSSTNETIQKSLVSSFTEAKLKERNSPADKIKESQIHVTDNSVVIDIQDPEWSKFTDTNSMDPVLDEGANAIHIVPKSENEIQVGDIVAYKSEYADGTIIHRVIEINKDDEGTFYILKGDNNPEPDPGRVRFSQIRRVLVAIIY